MKQKLRWTTYVLSAWFLLALLAVPQAQALSLTGNFTNDDDVQLQAFTVTSASQVTFQSFSASGGTNAAGTFFFGDGFDLGITVFDGSGNFINDNFFGAPGTVAVDFLTGVEMDVFLQLNLTAGNYTVAITQWDNLFLGSNLSSPSWQRQGSPNFTDSIFGCGQGQFCDFAGNNRFSNWALDITGSGVPGGPPGGGPGPAIPEPSTLLLFGTGIAAITAWRLKRMRDSSV